VSQTNAEQITYWNEVAGQRWVEAQELLDDMIGPLGLHAMLRADVEPGQRILDVGCGCGDSTLELASRAGGSGSVVGIDISAPMLERAEKRADFRPNVRFEQADAQVHRFPPDHFDRVFSRFGVMFFEDPVAAFANLCGATKKGGRVAFVCWQEVGRNPWMLQPLLAAAKHIELPAPPAPGEPGPFAFADADRVAGILRDAGLCSIGFESFERTLQIAGGRDLEQARDFILGLGPLARVMASVTDPDTRQKVGEAVSEAMAPHQTPNGVEMPCAAWIVTALRS
jgi:SAM-dependent methyltransferase